MLMYRSSIFILTLCALATIVSTPRTATAQTCPIAATGLCTVSHPTPGCIDQVCCAVVCAIDPFCCMTAWDAQCVFIAVVNCEVPPPTPCGSPSAGSCIVIHETPSCSDAACCDAVCSVYAFCCSNAWDQTCVSAAFAICQSSCTPVCPAQSTAENEPCNATGPGNSPCIDGAANPSLLTVVNSKFVCGDFRYLPGGTTGTPDLDTYRLVLPDGNGDGLARLNLSLQAERGTQESGQVPVFAALLSDPCDDLSQAIMVVQTTGCATIDLWQCVPSGTSFLVLARGTFPTPEPFAFACGALQSYNIQATWDDQCSSPCGSAGDCFAKHATAGCQDAFCCANVCQIDPVCCQKSWDQQCVDLAVSQCSPPIPTNDECSQAIAVGIGTTPFTLVAATAGSTPVPLSCFATPTAVGVDVWYRLHHLRGSVSVSTCGVGSFNTAIMVYPFPCDGSSTAIVCNDDNELCTANPSSARVTFTAACGNEYLVRVASVAGSIGAGSLTVTSTGTPCPLCPADINHDGVVDGSDLSTLLSGWGSTGGGDVDGNGIVEGADLTSLLSGWGACP